MNAEPGTYALLLRAEAKHTVEVGALGDRTVRPGIYAYVGSALGPGGVRARVRRHARTGGAMHWHVDYLRAVTTLGAVWYAHDPVRRECTWAATLRETASARVPIDGFGASDCDCPAHLVYFDERPAWSAFRRRIRETHPDHAPIDRIDGSIVPGE